MKKMIRLSNPLHHEVVMTREILVNIDELHTFLSESDALELQLFKAFDIVSFCDNKFSSVPLKIQSGNNVAFVTAFVTGDKTVIGRVAMDELSNRL